MAAKSNSCQRWFIGSLNKTYAIYQEWKAHAIRNTGGKEWRQQLHLSLPKLSSDIEVICVPYILLTVVWNQMVNCPVILSGWIWVYQTLRRNRTPWTHPCLRNSNLCCLATYIHLYSTLHNVQVLNSCWWRSNMQRACCPFYASLLFENVLKKGVWSWTLWIEIYLVAYGFWHEVCCLFAPES